MFRREVDELLSRDARLVAWLNKPDRQMLHLLEKAHMNEGGCSGHSENSTRGAEFFLVFFVVFSLLEGGGGSVGRGEKSTFSQYFRRKHLVSLFFVGNQYFRHIYKGKSRLCVYFNRANLGFVFMYIPPLQGRCHF